MCMTPPRPVGLVQGVTDGVPASGVAGADLTWGDPNLAPWDDNDHDLLGWDGITPVRLPLSQLDYTFTRSSTVYSL